MTMACDKEAVKSCARHPPVSSGMTMQLGETPRPGPSHSLSVWCKTATAAQQFVAVEQALMLQNMYLRCRPWGWGLDIRCRVPLIVARRHRCRAWAFALSIRRQGAKTDCPIPLGWMACLKPIAHRTIQHGGRGRCRSGDEMGQGGLFTSDGESRPFRQRQVLQDECRSHQRGRAR